MCLAVTQDTLPFCHSHSNLPTYLLSYQFMFHIWQTHWVVLAVTVGHDDDDDDEDHGDDDERMKDHWWMNERWIMMDDWRWWSGRMDGWIDGYDPLMTANREHGRVGRLDHRSMKFRLSLDLQWTHHIALVTIYQQQWGPAVNTFITSIFYVNHILGFCTATPVPLFIRHLATSPTTDWHHWQCWQSTVLGGNFKQPMTHGKERI